MVARSALRDPALPARLGWTAVALVLLWPLLQASEFRPWIMLDAQGRAGIAAFLGTFFPPATDREFLLLVLQATWVTIAIATAGLAFAAVVALPLTLMATARLSRTAVGRPMGAVQATARRALRAVMIALRSVPEIVWALVLVRLVGLGPTAGVLALAIGYSGMLGKVWSEILESADPAPTLALLRNGAGRLGAFLHGTLPQCAPELVSYTVYRWECAVRASVVMGFVGAGGLGQRLDESMKALAGGEVLTLLLVFVGLVALADRASRALRAAIE